MEYIKIRNDFFDQNKKGMANMKYINIRNDFFGQEWMKALNDHRYRTAVSAFYIHLFGGQCKTESEAKEVYKRLRKELYKRLHTEFPFDELITTLSLANVIRIDNDKESLTILDSPYIFLSEEGEPKEEKK